MAISLLDELLFESRHDEWASAAAYNKRSARRLGWLQHLKKIQKLLGTRSSYTSIHFAAAVVEWQAQNGFRSRDIDGKLGPQTWRKMRAVLFRSPLLGPINRKYGIEDFTDRADWKRCSEWKGYNCKRGSRPMSQLRSIVLHQTAGSTSTNANRYLAIPIHYVVLSNGRILQLYPDTEYLNHAGALNRYSIGIEFAGSFVNASDECWMNRRYVPRGTRSGSRVCGDPTLAQIRAGRRLIRAIKEKVPGIRNIYAHRQSSRSRADDPGPTIWREVGEWAKRQLGFRNGNKFVIGTGRPIPDAWT
ncbi:MAG: N-acetylmuramoyl-L-alanine amidase [Bacteroidota bacterium]